MKTYLVRTIEDQVLVGVFCATSLGQLTVILDAMVEPHTCEVLVLGANDGLFIEAQFVHAPSGREGAPDTVFLTNAPHGAVPPEDAATAAATGTLADAMAEIIPPVLEPSEALMGRLQTAEARGWLALAPSPGTRSPGRPRAATPVWAAPGDPSRLH